MSAPDAAMEQSLPYLTDDIEGIGGELRASHDDFVVEEVPAYLPSGGGEHTYVRFEKRGLTTPEAVGRFAAALGVAARDIGYAGLKDRHARTTQWLSLPRVDPERVAALSLADITVLELSRHSNKLRTGHLVGNRFTIRVTGVSAPDAALARARAALERLVEVGVPNYYGAQRFGRDGDNFARGAAWLGGRAPAPRDRFQRKMLASSVQSELFNRSLADRVRRGELARFVDGDLAVRRAHGRPWAIREDEAAALYPPFEASATGPMFGPSMPAPVGVIAEREAEVLGGSGLRVEDFSRAEGLAEGARRAVRVRPEEVAAELDGDALRLVFTLPAGAYATVLLRELMKRDVRDGLKQIGAGGIQPAPLTWSDDAG